MRTVLLCHRGATLDHEGMMRFLASFSELVGVVVLEENRSRTAERVRKQIARSGAVRFADVLAFRFYYKALLAKADNEWELRKMAELRQTFPNLPQVPELVSSSPNTPEVEAFLKGVAPDLMIARCKTLLRERIFSIPRRGTIVMHPGVAPEYRNSHGCFWALVERDLSKVGMTMLRIDKGVDTGPVYGYFSYPYDEKNESHVVIQHRVVWDNLETIAAKLKEVAAGTAVPLTTQGRPSGTWGQPFLTSYLKWKWAARSSRPGVGSPIDPGLGKPTAADAQASVGRDQQGSAQEHS